MTLDEEDVRALIRETVAETLTALGLEARRPLEAQKDFAFLRSMREATSSVRARAIVGLVGLLLSGFAALVALGVREWVAR